MSEKKRIDFNLSELNDGAAQEQIDKELEKIMKNILDLDTEAKLKRKLTITVDFVPDDSRRVITTDVQVKSTLAPQERTTTTMLAGRDIDTGFIEAQELKSHVPGQTFIDDGGELNTDVGEKIDDDGKVIDKVIDFNKNRQSN